MKYCVHCGKEISDDSRYCPFCGQSQDEYKEYEIEQQVIGNPQEKKSGLKMAAFILALLTCITSALAIFPLLWTIPMTVKIYKSYKEGLPLSTGFKVCTILFLNVIAGILLLIDNN